MGIGWLGSCEAAHVRLSETFFVFSCLTQTGCRDHGRSFTRGQPVRIRAMQSRGQDQPEEHGYQLFGPAVSQTGAVTCVC